MKKAEINKVFALFTIIIIAFVYCIMLQNSACVSLNEDTETYIVCVYNGHICVYEPYSFDIPSVILDSRIEHLPSDDRSRLIEGITVTGKQELRSLLENYTG